MEKKSNPNRARQFLPFNSLRGYYDLVRKQEIIKAKKKVLADEEAAIISDKLNMLKRGMLVKIKYYKDYGYIEIEGMVANIDQVYHKITIVSQIIDFNDIINIESEELNKLDLSKDF